MLVAFEGIDGSGKTTVMRRVAARLRARGVDLVTARQPTRSWLGRAVRRGIREHVDPVAQAALFLADRAQHASALKQASRKHVVLVDRYVDSTSAYQGAALAGQLKGALERLDALQRQLFPVPDLVVWLDVSPRVAVSRLATRATKEHFEREAFLRRVRTNYRTLHGRGGDRWIRLDAGRGVDLVTASATEGILERV